MAVNQIPPQAPLVYISFSAEVNPHTSETLIAVMAQCANVGVQKVYLLLSTPGGSVMNGMNVFEVIRGFPFELTTHNVGNVDSIGNVMFLAGEHRYATARSTFMFHGVGLMAQQGQRLEEKLLREYLGNIQADHTRIGRIIAERSRLGETEVEKLFLEAQTRDAEWAMSQGIVHEIKDVHTAPGAPVIPLVFQR